MCVVRQLSVIATILCILVSGCDRKDPEKPVLWRTIEPMTEDARWLDCHRRPLQGNQIVADVQCHPPPAEPVQSSFNCRAIADPVAARAIGACPDEAIAVLQDATDAVSRAHLAAALYVRAARKNRPQDLLPAHDAATRAAAMTSRPRAALFNRALIEEALGLREQAIASWREFVTSEAEQGWIDEARKHIDLLNAQRRDEAAAQWPLMPARIEEALRKRDAEALRKRIEAFPSAVASYLTETVLPEWAETLSPARLEEARFLGEELSRVTGDPYSREVVAAVMAAPDRETLRRGLLGYRTGIRTQSLLQLTAPQSFRRAADALARSNNPLHLEARARSAFNAGTEGFATLDQVEREALRHGYLRVNAILHLVRLQNYKTDFLKSLRASDEALALYRRTEDAEQLAKSHSRRGEALRVAGQNELAWREVVQAMRYAPALHSRRDRQFLLLEANKTALALGHPQTALLYANTDIALFQREFQQVPASDLETIAALRAHIAIGRRQRADVLIRLGRTDQALEDLSEADRLTENTASPTRRIVDAASQAIRGDALLQSDPEKAHVAFTLALEQTKPGELHTRRAWLLAQRAEARRRMNIDPESDLLASIRELESEQNANLAKRKAGEGEAFWSAYLSRFPEPHQRLVQHYIDQKRYEDAFRIAERVRGHEPLQLVLGLPDVPAGFRQIVANDGADVLQSARSMLPPGTFILQYAILRDRSYVFIVGKGFFDVVRLDVSAKQVDGWRTALRRAVEHRDEKEFVKALTSPYALVAEPLRRLPRDPYLIFVPDGAMHGMPIAAFRDPARRFLIQKATVSVAPSTSLYLHSRLRDAALPRDTAPTLLLAGDPLIHKNAVTSHMRQLPDALLEVEQIRSCYGTGATVLAGAAATIPAFFAAAQNKSIVHVAAHSIVAEDAPWQSMLVLAPSKDHETGLLTAEELVTKTWTRTRLMVLSSCSSAGGSPVGAEGVAPLVRPILAAGVPAVIGSLWDVEDATAKEFLVSFHCRYQSGSDAASAMRHAQLLLLGNNNNTGHASVFKWAGFQVIGHASSPSTAR